MDRDAVMRPYGVDAEVLQLCRPLRSPALGTLLPDTTYSQLSAINAHRCVFFYLSTLYYRYGEKLFLL